MTDDRDVQDRNVPETWRTDLARHDYHAYGTTNLPCAIPTCLYGAERTMPGRRPTGKELCPIHADIVGDL